MESNLYYNFILFFSIIFSCLVSGSWLGRQICWQCFYNEHYSRDDEYLVIYSVHCKNDSQFRYAFSDRVLSSWKLLIEIKVKVLFSLALPKREEIFSENPIRCHHPQKYHPFLKWWVAQYKYLSFKSNKMWHWTLKWHRMMKIFQKN